MPPLEIGFPYTCIVYVMWRMPPLDSYLPQGYLNLLLCVCLPCLERNPEINPVRVPDHVLGQENFDFERYIYFKGSFEHVSVPHLHNDRYIVLRTLAGACMMSYTCMLTLCV